MQIKNSLELNLVYLLTSCTARRKCCHGGLSVGRYPVEVDTANCLTLRLCRHTLDTPTKLNTLDTQHLFEGIAR